MQKAQFIKTAVLPKDYPLIRNESGRILPEVAVAGRSNVGKSSLLNDLFGTNQFVKTSSTPGKTQAINFFTFENIAFADLPGYGYAKVSRSVKKGWGSMIQTYLSDRKELKLILFLLDIRRIPSDEDLQFLDWVVHHEKAMIAVMTKVDKVTLNERNRNMNKILEGLRASNIHCVYYSVTKNQGRKELMAMISEALKDESSEIREE